MKTPKLQRGDDGQYPDAISAMIRLNAEQSTAVRKVLLEAKEPIHISEIARRAGLEMKAGQVSDYVSNYLLSTARETEMVFEETRRGRKFAGWKLTAHGREMARLG